MKNWNRFAFGLVGTCLVGAAIAAVGYEFFTPAMQEALRNPPDEGGAMALTLK